MWINEIQIRNNQEEAVAGITPEYPYVMHLANIKKLQIPWHWHEEVEFVYVTGGQLHVQTPDQSYDFKKGEGFFINSNILCSMEGTGNDTSSVIQSHLFHPVFLSGHFKSVFETKYINPVLQNKNLEIMELRGENRTQQKILVKLGQASTLAQEEDTEFQMRNLFSEIWILLLAEIQRISSHLPAVNLQNADRIQTMLSFIHKNYMNKISLEQIADSALVSSRECLRCFRDTIHKSPVEYLMDYRLDMAKRLLKETDMNITEIGFQCGFSSNAYFGKVFKQRCGITPFSYRKTSM